MNPMNTAPRDGRIVLLKWASTNGYCVGRSNKAEDGRFGTGGYLFDDSYFSGWYDIDALLADRARIAELLRKALAYIPSIALVTPEGCDESMVQPHPLRVEIEKELSK